MRKSAMYALWYYIFLNESPTYHWPAPIRAAIRTPWEELDLDPR